VSENFENWWKVIDNVGKNAGNRRKVMIREHAGGRGGGGAIVTLVVLVKLNAMLVVQVQKIAAHLAVGVECACFAIRFLSPAWHNAAPVTGAVDVLRTVRRADRTAAARDATDNARRERLVPVIPSQHAWVMQREQEHSE
jgi:hypothetical protein